MTPRCPFNDPRPEDPHIPPEEPCPVCGDLGIWDEVETYEDNCIWEEQK